MLIRKIIIPLFLCSVAYSQPKPLGKEAYSLDFGEPKRLEVIVGDKIFKPKVDFRIWDEDNITFEYIGTTGTPEIADGKLTLETPELGMDWQGVGKKLKWIFRLKSKPLSNKNNLKLGGNWQDFNFNYQTPFANPTKFTRDGEEWLRQVETFGISERPRSVDGSYAVYHKTKRDYQAGEKNYRTGKVLHIYVPKATEANNKSVWCELNIENGIYTVTIPQAFLDSAVYPVLINDTFGDSDIGGTETENTKDYIVAFGTHTPASDGSATSVSLYTRHTTSARNITLGIYDNDAGGPNNLLKDTGEGVTLNADWTAIALDSALAVTNGTSYWLASCNDGGAAGINYDTDVTKSAIWKADSYVAGVLVNPFPASPGTNADKSFSVYATYTPTVAAEGQVIFINMQ